MPREGVGGLVSKSLHSHIQRKSCPRRQSDSEEFAVDVHGAVREADGRAGEMVRLQRLGVRAHLVLHAREFVFPEGARLHDDFAGIKRIEINQLKNRAVRLDLGHKRRHIRRKARADFRTGSK